MIKENINPKGLFKMLVIDALTGKVLEEYENNNLVVSAGKSNLSKLLVGDAAGSKVSKIGFGTNATAPVIGDTALQGAFTKAISSYSYPAAGQVMITWTLETDEGNGMSINELGLLTDAGTLFARKVRSTITKTSAIRLVGTWTISIN